MQIIKKWSQEEEGERCILHRLNQLNMLAKNKLMI